MTNAKAQVASKSSPNRGDWIVFVVGALLSVLAMLLLHRQEQVALDQRVDALASTAANLVTQRFDRYQYGLRGLRGAAVASGVDRFNRSAFDAYMASRNGLQEFPGARGFGVIRKVPRGDLSQFVKKARADGAPDFNIRQITPHTNDLFVIQYIAPKGGNEAAIGLDIGSEAFRRHSATQASMNNEARLTRPLTLVQADGQARRGFLMLLPIYRSNKTLQSPEDRERATYGWAYAPLLVDEVLMGTQDTLREISITLTDAEETEPFYTSGGAAVGPGAVHATREIRAHGRTWVLKASSLPGMARAVGGWSTWWVLALGLLLSIAAALAMRALQAKPAPPVQLENGEAADWKSFLRSPVLVGAGQVYLGTLVAVAVVGLVYEWKQHLQEFATDSQLAVNRAATMVAQGDEARRKAVTFLASTSSSLALTRALGAAPKLRDAAQIEGLRRNVANNLSAFMVSAPEIFQARMIGLANDGMELVRVERKGEHIVALSKAELQAKGQEPYMKSAHNLQPGQIWVSEITLNREFGKVALPAVPTLRYAAPLFSAQGQLFGIIILNVDARAMLSDWAKLAPPFGSMYATKRSGDFVIHPDPGKTFGIDYGRPYAWDDAFVPAPLPWGIGTEGVNAWRDQDGLLLAASASAAPMGSGGAEGMRLLAGVRLSTMAAHFWRPLIAPIVGMLLVGLLGTVFLYWRWLQSSQFDAHERERIRTSQQDKDRMLFQGVLESAPVAMLLVDSSGIILLTNARVTQLFGHAADALVGQPVEVLLPGRLANAQKSLIQQFFLDPQARALGGSESRTLYGCNVDGDEFPVEVSLGPVKHHDQLMVVASVRDLTQQREFESQLRMAKDEAEQATQAKSAFLANMSHEIRTPLNAVIGFSGLLSDDELSALQHSYLEKIQLSGRALLSIVNDVLDLAKIEANELGLDLLACQPAEMLTQLASVFSTQAKTKGLDFVLTLDPQLPPWVMADCNRVGQVLTNLLGNALKFTRSGQVSLSAEVLYPADERGAITLQLSVADTGEGIAPDALQRLFMPFSQADVSTARRYGGTGLGLSIVKRVVELMGGAVGVQSTPGLGSCFWVNLPLKLLDAVQVADRSTIVDPVQVLLAEDDPDERTRLVAMTRALGWQNVAVTNGAEMVSTYRERLSSSKTNFDALIVDWQMPELDGLSALAALSKELCPDTLPAVLMISAHEREQIVALDEGHLVDQLLSKPVDAAQLFNAVNDIVKARTGNNMRVLQATKTDAVVARWLPGMRVLVADDSEMNLKVVSAILERSGALVTQVTNGQDALDHLLRVPDGFDAVLMDVQMPGMDGLEATSRLRQHPALTTLPVIALTAGALMEEKRRALQAGMTDFLTKPVEPNKLITCLLLAVERHQGKPLPAERILPRGAKLPVKSASWLDITGIDSEAAVRMFDGDLNLFFATLKRLLASEVPQNPPRDGIGASAWRSAAIATIHKLRGSAGMIGATRLHQLAGAAEKELRQAVQYSQDSQATLALVQTELSALQDAIRVALQTWHHQQAQAGPGGAGDATDAAMARLMEMLIKRDLNVLECAEEMAAHLRARLGLSTHSLFCTLLENLNFTQARDLLETAIEATSKRAL